MILALSYWRIPGISCPREMRPTPIAPMLMRLLGAFWPKTVDGTIAGKPATAAAPRLVFMIDRRDIDRREILFIMFSLKNSRVLLRFEHQFGGQQGLLL